MFKKIPYSTHEEWRSIEGYEQLYEISSMGRVKSLPRNGTTKKERILKLKLTKDKYYEVTLHKNNSPKCIRVHRLVAKAFIDNPLNKSQVNHKNFDRLDNRVENLEWNTPKENIIHAYYKGNKLKKILDKATKLNPYNQKKSIFCLNNNTVYESMVKASKELKVNIRGIRDVCNGKKNHVKNLKFKFVGREKTMNFKKILPVNRQNWLKLRSLGIGRK